MERRSKEATRGAKELPFDLGAREVKVFTPSDQELPVQLSEDVSRRLTNMEVRASQRMERLARRGSSRVSFVRHAMWRDGTP